MNELVEAVERDDLKSVKKLLKEGVDANERTHFERTVLMIAAYHNEIEIAKVLLNHPGIDINSQDISGNSAFDWALEREHTEMAELIRAHDKKTSK